MGRTLATSFDLFASSIRNGKSKGLEDALFSIFSGKGGKDITTNLAAATAGEFLNYGIQELFYKERTSVNSRESDRSRQALSDFRTSRGQQAAELTRMVQRGQRNL